MIASILAELKLFVKNQWLVLLVICILNIIAAPLVLPYALQLQPDLYPYTVPYVTLIILQLFSAMIINIPAATFGLYAAYRIGLGAPILHGILMEKRIPANTARIILYSFVIGIISGVGILLIITLSEPYMLAEYKRYGFEYPETTIPGAIEGLLGSISAGITEETLLRLFLLSILGWVGMKISRDTSTSITSIVFWVANILASLMFGALHLPVAALIMPLTPITILSTIGLNGLAGIVFGWLYKKYGLEGAMLAHFSADIVLHVITPLFVM
jgi:hypothetical protein